MNNPLRYTDPTGENPLLLCLTPWGAPICGALGGAALELAIQAGNNLWNGQGAFDCIEWGEVALAGGLGAFGGNWLKSGVKLTAGSMKWSNARRRIRNAEGLVNSGNDLHHWLVPQKWYGKNGFIPTEFGENIFNRPWNLRILPEQAHSNLHKLPYWMQVPLGAPRPVQGAGLLGLGGAGVEMLDGDWE
jgi:hypothetical protein